MAKLDYWKRTGKPKLIDIKALETLIKKDNGDITLEDIQQEAEFQITIELEELKEKNYLLFHSDPATVTINWVYEPELFKKLMNITTPISKKPPNNK